MDTERIINAIRDILVKHVGSERELYEALCSEADKWKMRLEELEDEENDN